MTVPVAHKDRAHALLSASGADRWINCPPSARLEEQFEDTTSDFAREGTLAHEIAELKLRKHFTDPMSTRTFNTRLNKLKKEELYQDEMLGYTDTYLEYIKGVVYGYANSPHIAVEARLDFSHIVPDGFGTGDCLIIGGDTLHVIDFKYGKGVSVSAEDNPQMMLYALGALQKYAMLYGINTIKIVIAQPRLDSISEWEISDTDLVAWGESIKPIAQLAFDGKGEFKAGDHCKFCRAKAQCRARTDTMTALEAFGLSKPPLISDEEVGSILKTAQTLKSWVSDLEGYALKALLSGKDINGWKAVEGRSNRQFDDTDKAFETIKASGIDEALLYERKPITLTAVEKLLGKKDFTEILSEHIIKPPGKPTLAPETDKRDAITLQTTAKDAFAETNINNENGGN